MQRQVIQEVMHWLFERVGAEPDFGKISRVMRDIKDFPEEEIPLSWRETLELAATPLFLEQRELFLSLEELGADERHFPLLTCVQSAQEVPRWFGVWGRERGRLRVTEFSEQRTERWVSAKELGVWMGVDTKMSLTWVTMERRAPLEDWKSDGGAGKVGGVPETLWDRFFGLIKGERRELWMIAVYAIAIGVLTLVTPLVVQSLVNTVAFGTLLQPLVVLSLMLAAGLIFIALMQAVQTFLVEMINRRVFVRVVEDFTTRFLRVQQTELHKPDTSMLSNYFFDVLTLQKVLAVLLFDGLAAVLSMVSGLLLLAVYHPALLVFDIFLMLSIVLLIFVLGRGAIATSIQESKKKHLTAAWLDQLLEHNTMYKSDGGHALAMARADLLTRQYLDARGKHFGIVMRQLLGGLAIQVLASAGLLLVGGWLVISQQLTLGQLVASELVVSVLVTSLFKLVKSFEKFYDLLASLDKLGKVIDLKLERSDGLPLPPSSDAVQVELKNVSAKDTSGRVSFEGLSASLAPGRKVAMCGLRDLEKSELGSILFGLRRPSDGQVHLNGQFVQDIRLGSLRRSVSLVRGVELFDGSILENVQLDRDGVSRASVRRALDIVGLLSHVLELPEGIHTHITEAGFSPRQQRELMLARGLAGRPGLLLLDGCLEPFNERSLAQIFEKLDEEFSRETTLIVLTNRAEVANFCDEVLVLNHLQALTEPSPQIV